MKLTTLCNAMLMASLTLTGCGGGGGGGGGGSSVDSGVGSDGLTSGAGATGGIFGDSLYLFENQPQFTGGAVVDNVLRTRISRSGDVLSMTDAAILGPTAVAPVKEYTATATRFATTPATVTADGVRTAFLTDSNDNTFTLAAYDNGGAKSVGLIIMSYQKRDLSGLLLADYIGAQLNRGPGGTTKVMHLRTSGRTFPSGSWMLSVTKMTYPEDTVEFSEDEQTEYTGLAQWRAEYPGADFQNYSFHDVEVSCVADPEIPVQYRDCGALWAGKVYLASVSPKGDYPVPDIMPVSYFNGPAADALTSGIKADFR